MRIACILCAALLLVGCKGRKEAPAPTAFPEAAATAAPAENAWDGAGLESILVISGGEESYSGGGYTSAEPDEIAVLSRGGALTLSGTDISKTGDTAAPDLARKTGCNAAVNMAAGASLTASEILVTTNALGATGIHVMGENAAADLQNTMIVTAGADSPALSAFAGGALTAGGATLTAEGAGSPCVYLADGSAKIAGGMLKSLRTACLLLEGAAAADCADAALTGAVGVAFADKSPETALMAEGETAAQALCELRGGSLRGAGTDALITSAHANACLRLSNVTIDNPSGKLLSVSAGALRVEANGQTLTGLVEAAPGTGCTLALINGSLFTGAFLGDDQRSFSLELDAASRLSLTEDSYIGALQNADASFANVSGNGYSLYYDSSLEANAWLGGKSFALANGGYLVPLI